MELHAGTVSAFADQSAQVVSNDLKSVFAPQPAGEARPAPRGGHACVVIGNKVLVFGGADRTARPFGDIWLLDREGDVPGNN